jgi:hypothetical protein
VAHRRPDRIGVVIAVARITMRFKSLTSFTFFTFSGDYSKARTIGGWSPGVRTLVGSRVLPCGCLTGVYETWSNDQVTIIDAHGQACTIAMHETNGIL